MEYNEQAHRKDMDDMQTQFGFPKEECSHCGERDWGNDSLHHSSYYCLTCGSSYKPPTGNPQPDIVGEKEVE